MSWALVIAGTAWLVLAVLFALLIGRAVRIADAHEFADESLDDPNFVLDRAPVETGAYGAESTLDESQRPLHPPNDRDAPTIPGLPSARPSAARSKDPRRQAQNWLATGQLRRGRRSQSG